MVVMRIISINFKYYRSLGMVEVKQRKKWFNVFQFIRGVYESQGIFG